MATVEEKLASMGITLPEPAAPAAAYVPTVRTGDQLFVSGQLPLGLDPLPVATLTAADHIEQGAEPGAGLAAAQAAARQCAINLIAQAKSAAGSLENVTRVVKLVGFVNSAPDFRQQHLVVNGASQLMQDAFGDRGFHARSAVGVAALPFGVVVEVEAIFEL
ncbi:MAG: RidA family protein, partial [Pseudomonadota bacterium]